MADIVMGTKLLNSGIPGTTEGLGGKWQVLKQAGLDDAASWDAIRNVAVVQEQRQIDRLKADTGPRSDVAFYTGWADKQERAIRAREDRLSMLLNLQNPYRPMGVAA